MKSDNLIDMKNNLIQTFYIIGLPPKDFFQMKNNNKGLFINLFKKDVLIPKIISKFPPTNNNFNEVLDEIIIDHSFTNGLNLIISSKNNKEARLFYFELDNLLFNYPKEEKNIYSKLYFTCLEFYEPLNAYYNYKNEIKKLNKAIEIKDDFEDKKELYKDKFIYIPKIICFASVLPFYLELGDILYKIYKLYSQNQNNQIMPIEKLIEQTILSIPIPIMNGKHLELLFECFDKNISFTLFNENQKFLVPYYTNIHFYLFQFFSIENIIKLFKCILLEIPILFFYDNKYYLSSIIESFLSLISPFKYILPCISILPKKLYGLINKEKKFLFGINEKYDYSFFYNNDIEINKNIMIVNILPDYKSKLEEILNKQNNDNNILIINDESEIKSSLINENIEGYSVFNDYILYNDNKYDSIINLVNSKLAYETILEKDIINFFELINSSKISKDNSNYIIQNIFYKFMFQILAGYNEYILNSKYFYKSKDYENEIIYRKNIIGLSEFYFVKEIFDIEKFIKSHSNDSLFYLVFCQTKMFVNFLRERIYLNEEINTVPLKIFDQLTFLYKNKKEQNKDENKNFYLEHFKYIFQSRFEKIINKELSIKNKDFDEKEKEQLINKEKTFILMKYAQNIREHNNAEGIDKILIDYCLFPKLLYDDEFFNNKYDKNTYLEHGIVMPDYTIINNYKSDCLKYNEQFNKQSLILPERLDKTNNSGQNFEVISSDYIYFNWIILLCCSLFYCEPIERIARLDDILSFLKNLQYIEKIVLKLLFITFIKFGNKNQCIKIFEEIVNFYDYSNYYYLNLLTKKLCEKENDIYNKSKLYKGNKNTYLFKDRSLILGLGTFFQEIIDKIDNMNDQSLSKSYKNIVSKEKLGNNKKENNFEEKIIFSSEQYCEKCQCYNPFNFEALKDKELSKIKLDYKCPKCNTIIDKIIIKYQILLYNKRKKELFIIKKDNFELEHPKKLYQDLIKYLTKNEWEIDIDNILKKSEIDLFNYIFYFSSKSLSFDFLLPYKIFNNENMELIQNNLGQILSEQNQKRFSNFLENNQCEEINKKLIEDSEKEDFIPIDITNLNKYYDLVPCLINSLNDNYYLNPIEIQSVERNKNDKDKEINNIIKEKNYFTINSSVI